MSQNRKAVPFWSEMIESYQPSRIIELGTGNGAFSCLLSMACANIGADFITYDRWHDTLLERRWFKFHKFDYRYCDDIFKLKDELQAGITCSTGRCFVLCDNGNKVEEFKLIAPMLKKGDVIGAHDFVWNGHWDNSEITLSDIAITVSRHALRRLEEERSGEAAWLVYEKA